MTIGWVMSHWWVRSLGSKRQHWIYNTRLSHIRQITFMSHDYWMSHVSLMSHVSWVKTAILGLKHVAVIYEYSRVWVMTHGWVMSHWWVMSPGLKPLHFIYKHLAVLCNNVTCLVRDSQVSQMSYICRIKTASLFLQHLAVMYNNVTCDSAHIQNFSKVSSVVIWYSKLGSERIFEKCLTHELHPQG